MRQGRVSWPLSATTNWTAKPRWYLASAPLPLSYSALFYMVHLPPLGFPKDWSRVLLKLPFQAAFSATWAILSWPFPLPEAAARYPRLALFHARWFHSFRSPVHSTPISESTPLHWL